MSSLAKTLALAIAVSLVGCAATVGRPQGDEPKLASAATPTQRVVFLITANPKMQSSADWQTFRAEWRTAFENAAAAAGLTPQYVENEPAGSPAGTALVRITVNDYRYLTAGARYGFGAMAGNAFIASLAKQPFEERAASNLKCNI